MEQAMQDIKYGRVVHRREDARLTQGKGLYAGDISLERMTHAVFVRSPHAFARIRNVDAAAALALPGVIGVLTAADMEGLGSVARPVPQPGLHIPFRPALVGERAMHSGEPVALVVAETREAAQDAADLVEVEYEELAPAVDLRDAVAPGEDRTPAGRRNRHRARTRDAGALRVDAVGFAQAQQGRVHISDPVDPR